VPSYQVLDGDIPEVSQFHIPFKNFREHRENHHSQPGLIGLIGNTADEVGVCPGNTKDQRRRAMFLR
jgi:hypothetical protein